MDLIHQKDRKFVLTALLLAFTALSLYACQNKQGIPTTVPVQSPTNTKAIISTPLPTITPTRTQAHRQTDDPMPPSRPSPTPTPVVELSEIEPILVGCNPSELVLMNLDGTGLARISFNTLVQCSAHELAESVSSTGEMLVLRSGKHPEHIYQVGLEDKPDNLTLQIIKLPTGDLIKEIPLLSVELRQKIQAEEQWYLNDFIFPLLNIVPLWSPDGRYLAFVAALDGPSSDVYVYDSEEDQIRRLTDGPNQAWLMSWSPDSQWIVHMEATHMMIGGGSTSGFPDAKAVWSAAPDGSEVWKVYETDHPGEQQIAGWLSSVEFVVQTRDFYNPYPYHLRTVNLVTSAINDIYSCFGMFGDITSDGVVIFWSYGDNTGHEIGNYFAEKCKETIPSGLYLFVDGEYQPISGFVTSTRWFPEIEKMIHPSSDGTQVMYSDGKPYLLFVEERCFPEVSPDGKWFAFLYLCQWHHSGSQQIRIYKSNGVMERNVVVGQTNKLFWHPAVKGVYFMVDTQIWFLSNITGELLQIHPDTGVEFFIIVSN